MIESFASAVDTATLEENAACCAPSSKGGLGRQNAIVTSFCGGWRQICRPLTNLCIRWGEDSRMRCVCTCVTSGALPLPFPCREPIEAARDGSALTVMDVIPDDFALDEHFEQQDEGRRLRRLVDTLTARERQVILLRYGLGGQPPLTQQQAAALLGISRSYVSRIEKRALELLRRQVDQS